MLWAHTQDQSAARAIQTLVWLLFSHTLLIKKNQTCPLRADGDLRKAYHALLPTPEWQQCAARKRRRGQGGALTAHEMQNTKISDVYAFLHAPPHEGHSSLEHIVSTPLWPHSMRTVARHAASCGRATAGGTQELQQAEAKPSTGQKHKRTKEILSLIQVDGVTPRGQ